jgi:hypothetical protein
MSSATESDKLDVQKVVRLLLKNPYLIGNRGRLWDILDIPCAEVISAEEKYRADLITMYGLFTKIINIWKSNTSGTPEELCAILIENQFKTSAGNLKIFEFHIADCAVRYFPFLRKIIDKLSCTLLKSISKL